jgi:hypothetical protein
MAEAGQRDITSNGLLSSRPLKVQTGRSAVAGKQRNRRSPPLDAARARPPQGDRTRMTEPERPLLSWAATRPELHHYTREAGLRGILETHDQTRMAGSREIKYIPL